MIIVQNNINILYLPNTTTITTITNTAPAVITKTMAINGHNSHSCSSSSNEYYY